jgi:hypothetical protein
MMSMNLKSTAVLCALFFKGIAVNAQIDSSITVENKRTFFNTNLNYEITVPSNWICTVGKANEYILYSGPRIDSGYFRNDGSFAITIEQLSRAMTNEEAMDMSLKNIKSITSMTNFKMLEHKNILINENSFLYINYQGTVSGIVFSSMQFYLVKNEKLFTLGGTIPSETFGKYKELYYTIAASFKLK